MTSGDDGASEPAYRKDRRRFAAREETRRLRPFLSGSDAAIPSRRTALTLMAALPLAASPVAALAQTETAPPAPDTLRLFRNLLTRMGVAVALMCAVLVPALVWMQDLAALPWSGRALRLGLACAAGLAVYLGALALLFPVGRHLWRHVPSGRHPSE